MQRQMCVHYAYLHLFVPTWGALRPQCCGARESSVQLARAVLLGLQVINEKRDWMVWSLSYQFGHQLLQEQSKAERSQMKVALQKAVRECGQWTTHHAEVEKDKRYTVLFCRLYYQGRVCERRTGQSCRIIPLSSRQFQECATPSVTILNNKSQGKHNQTPCPQRWEHFPSVPISTKHVSKLHQKSNQSAKTQGQTS